MHGHPVQMRHDDVGHQATSSKYILPTAQGLHFSNLSLSWIHSSLSLLSLLFSLFLSLSVSRSLIC